MFKYLLSTTFLVLGISMIFITYSPLKTYAEENNVTKKDFGKVLVVYYSLNGNTRNIAMRIKEKTNADIYEIKTVRKYSSSPMIYITAKKEMNPKNYPDLKEKLPDFSQYDLIFVGSPVWWYTVASPVLSFLSQADFKEKTVVSFATHGGNYGSFFEDFEKKAKNANVIKGKDFKKVLKENEIILNNKISNWLNNLNI